MAITIRKVEEVREELKLVKKEQNVKTDSKAMLTAVQQYRLRGIQIEMYRKQVEELEEELADYKRIMSGLEMYLASALEKIRQQELF